MRSLIETITDKAHESFQTPISRDEFDVWKEHWLTTGDQWRNELLAEGLVITASKVQEIMEQERKF